MGEVPSSIGCTSRSRWCTSCAQWEIRTTSGGIFHSTPHSRLHVTSSHPPDPSELLWSPLWTPPPLIESGLGLPRHPLTYAPSGGPLSVSHSNGLARSLPLMFVHYIEGRLPARGARLSGHRPRASLLPPFSSSSLIPSDASFWSSVRPAQTCAWPNKPPTVSRLGGCQGSSACEARTSKSLMTARP
eukprot:730358-Prorocentrum_minimum.AAC.4